MFRTIPYLHFTIDQNLGKNKTDILHLVNEKNLGRVEFMEEKDSGKMFWKQRKIAPLLEELKRVDVILLSEFSRLGRSMFECLGIIFITMEKGKRVIQ